MHIQFPKTVAPLGWHESEGVDVAVWLKIGLPTADLDTMLEGSPFAAVELRDDRWRMPADLDETWWRTHEVRDFRFAEADLRDGSTLSMLIDLDDENTAVVYLFWMDPS